MFIAAVLASTAIASPAAMPPVVFAIEGPRWTMVADPSDPSRRVRAQVDTVVSVTTHLVDSNALEGLPSSRNYEFLVNVRPDYPATPVRQSGQLVAQSSTVTPLNLDEVQEIQVNTGTFSPEWGRNLYSGVLNVVTKFENETLNEVKFDPNHGLQGNGWTRHRIGYTCKDLYADATFMRSTRVEGQPVSKRDLLGKTSFYVGSYYLPRDIRQDFYADGEDITPILKAVGGVTFRKEYADKIGINGLWLPRLSLSYDLANPGTSNSRKYLQDSIRTYGQERIMDWVSKSGLELGRIDDMMRAAAAQGQDMNRLNFPGDVAALGSPRCGSEMTMPPGVVWLPDEDGYQAMANYLPFSYRFVDYTASIESGAALWQAEMRTHCLNMALKEPAPGIRYYPYSSPDPLLSEVARMAGDNRIRGPWDQARTWIYTDKSPLDEINKRLSPGVTPGQYVNGLWDVARIGGLSREDMGNRRLFDSQLLAASSAREDAFAWVATHMSRKFGRDVKAWFDKNPPELVAQLGPAGRELDRKHPARLCRHVLASRNADARKGALGWLSRLETRPDLLKDQIGDLRPSFYSDDEKEVELALSVSEKYQSQRPKEAIQYLAAKGKSDSVRSKAQALLAG